VTEKAPSGLLWQYAPCVVGMSREEPPDYEVIALLCARAGMIMEDVAPDVVITGLRWSPKRTKPALGSNWD
jgi:hypothetical protein